MTAVGGPDDPRLGPERFWPRLAAALAGVAAVDRTPPPGARIGAVLVLLEDTVDGPRVVLTRRRRDLRSHPGQLSFPGGRVDPGESLPDAALREAEEEVGLERRSVEVLGTGPTFYVPPSRFWVAPVVARWRDPHPLRENPWEVDAILHVPLRDLLEPERQRSTPLELREAGWAWQLDDDLLWGATAVVMAVLLDAAIDDWHGGRSPATLGPDRQVRPWERAPRGPRPPRLDGDLPWVPGDGVPHPSAAEVRRMRAWLDAHGVGPSARAEQGGRAVVDAVHRLLDPERGPAGVTVLAGPSSNGVAGLSAVRLLVAAGHRVDVLLAGEVRDHVALGHLVTLGVSVEPVDAARLDDVRGPGEVVVDALLGIGTDPPLRDLPEVAARWLRRHDVPVVSVDLPSGLSADLGPRGVSVTADVTVALGLPTAGLASPLAHVYAGDVYVADLGVPASAWGAVGVPGVPETLFLRGPLVRVVPPGGVSDAATPDQGRVEPRGATGERPVRPVRAVGIEPTLGGV